MFKISGLTALLLASVTMPATAEMERFGSFIIDDDHPKLLILAGDIQQNAPIDLRRAMRRFPDVEVLALHSAGGDVTAGLLVAQEIFDRQIDTYIAPETGCYSACAYIFFAGARREVQGELGVHQMANDVGDQYSVQVAISDMLDTMAEFDVPPLVISEMLRTAPEDMRIYSATEASALGLNRVDGAVAAAEVEAPTQEYALPLASVPSPHIVSGSIPPNIPSPAAIYLASNAADGATPVYGQVWWSRSADPDGGEMVVAEASVWQAHNTLEAKVTWRKNTDERFPAESVLAVHFNYAGPGVADEVRRLPGVLAKEEPMVPGTPLTGASAMVREDEFIFALTMEEPASTDNSVLLMERYIDLALILESGRNAILTLEKDDTATAMFRDVLESWVD